jgi:hypothetical protein
MTFVNNRLGQFDKLKKFKVIIISKATFSE